MVCGSKYRSFLALQELFNLRLDHSAAAMYRIVHLAYNMNAGKYALSLADKLTALGLTPGMFSFTPLTQENNTPLSLPFLLGFYLGDGYA